MSIYPRPAPRTALQPYGVPGLPHGKKVLSIMLNLELSLQLSGSSIAPLIPGQQPIPLAQIAQEGESGITLTVTVLDPATRAPIDLRASTPLSVKLLPPGGPLRTILASFPTNGADGRVSVPLTPSDLANTGYYFAQVSISGGAHTTVIGAFAVQPNLPTLVAGTTEFALLQIDPNPYLTLPIINAFSNNPPPAEAPATGGDFYTWP